MNGSHEYNRSKYDDGNYYKSSFTDDYNTQKSSGYDVTDAGYLSSRVTKTQDISTRYRSESPRNMTSSPITSKYLGNDLNRTSSPSYRTSSPIGRTASPINRYATVNISKSIKEIILIIILEPRVQ